MTERLKDETTDRLKIKLNEFRLTIIVQLSLLTGRTKKGAAVIKQVYRVKGLESYKHLTEVGKVKDIYLEGTMYRLGDDYNICHLSAALSRANDL
jgi:hypothetical protein